MVNAAVIADPELAAKLVTEPLLAALEAELASLKDAQPSKVSWVVTIITERHLSFSGSSGPEELFNHCEGFDAASTISRQLDVLPLLFGRPCL